MRREADEELLESLKGLLQNSKYSDIVIQSREKTYRLHRAIVCPRSTVFAEKCQDTDLPSSGVVEIDVSNDDPRAVNMAVQFLYQLDYAYSVVARPTDSQNDTQICDHEPYQSPQSQMVVEDGVQGNEDGYDGSLKKGPASVGSQEDREIAFKSNLMKTPAKSPGRKGRKKKKSLSISSEQRQPIGTANGACSGNHDSGQNDGSLHVTEEEPHSIASDELVQPTNGEKAKITTPGSWQNVPEPHQPQTTGIQDAGTSLVIHAKVFSFSQKYGIRGLRSLALEKFENEAREAWNTCSFLLAAREAYLPMTMPIPPAECRTCIHDDDRRLQDAVTSIVCQHPELLDKEQTKEVIKESPTFAYDVLMKMRNDKAL